LSVLAGSAHQHPALGTSHRAGLSSRGSECTPDKCCMCWCYYCSVTPATATTAAVSDAWCLKHSISNIATLETQAASHTVVCMFAGARHLSLLAPAQPASGQLACLSWQQQVRPLHSMTTPNADLSAHDVARTCLFLWSNCCQHVICQ
jgi:hypothetical protein